MALNWDLLAQHRTDIRKAELAAWLHNLGKLSPEFVRRRRGYPFIFEWLLELESRGRATFAKTVLDNARQGTTHLRDTELKRLFREMTINTDQLNHHAEPYTLAELVEFHRPNLADPDLKFINSRPLLAIMAECHGEASGEEKEGANKVTFAQPTGSWPWYRISPFGHPSQAYLDEDQTWALQEAVVKEAKRIFDLWIAGKAVDTSRLKQLLDQGLADSRIPLNDVSVGDIGMAAAALLKACLVYALLTGKSGRSDCSWRLMRVAVGGLSYFSEAIRIGDLLARREGFDKLLNTVRDHLEVHCCFANEIYRDESGAVFILPGFGDPDQEREFDRGVKQEIETVWYVDEFGQELRFEIQRSDPFSHSNLGSAFQLGELLKLPAPPPVPHPERMRHWWHAGAHQREPCSTCGLRPILDQDENAKRRRICETCYKRRGQRAKEWLADRSTTIWLDEVGDKNRRFALIAARFRLEPWLTEKGYLSSTVFSIPPPNLIRPAGAPRDKAGRTISDSVGRLRRVFETTQEFWLDALRNIREGVQRQNFRGFLKASSSVKVAPSYSYDLVQKNRGGGLRRISAVWDGTSFHLVENLESLARRLRPDVENTIAALEAELRGPFDVMQPTGYVPIDLSPRRLNRIASFAGEVCFEDQGYARIIELADDPRQMFVLVPAADALKVTRMLLELFQDRMGRVRNRLALDVAAIMAPVQTPFRAVMDAARRALDRPPKRETWRIRCMAVRDEHVDLTFDNDVSWKIDTTLPPAYEQLKAMWTHPIPDEHFPYFEDADGRLLHVTKLRVGLDVKIEPSLFDFEFLDSASRRFEIAYDTMGRRRAAGRTHRPYPLEFVSTLERIWRVLSRLSRTQIHWLEGILAAKLQEWDELPPGFVEAAFRNLEWGETARPDSADLNLLIAAVESRLLFDALEFYRGVMKGEDE
jgi:hypothetical protein